MTTVTISGRSRIYLLLLNFPFGFYFSYSNLSIVSCSLVGRLFHHALEDSRPKSVLVHSLSVCMSLLDPKRLVSLNYQSFRNQLSHGSLVNAKPEMVDGMLESLGI